MEKVFFIVVVVFIANFSYAGDYSSWAVPTSIELVSGGVLIKGDFGDPNECGKTDYIYVNQETKSYESVLSMALSALMGKREMKFYSNTCSPVNFHWTGNVVNENKYGQAVFIR